MTTVSQVDIKAILDEYCVAWNDHDVDKIVSFYTDDGTYEKVWMEQVAKGKEELTTEFNEMLNAIPDFKLQWPSYFIGGNMASFEWIMTGTHLGDFPNLLPATGKAIYQRGSAIVEMRGNRIARQTNYMDNFTFLQKLGVMGELPIQMSGEKEP